LETPIKSEIVWRPFPNAFALEKKVDCLEFSFFKPSLFFPAQHTMIESQNGPEAMDRPEILQKVFFCSPGVRGRADVPLWFDPRNYKPFLSEKVATFLFL
jgi:hypothetical protein